MIREDSLLDAIGFNTRHENLLVPAVWLRRRLTLGWNTSMFPHYIIVYVYKLCAQDEDNAFSLLPCFNMLCGLGGLTGDNGDSRHLTCKSAVLMEK